MYRKMILILAMTQGCKASPDTAPPQPAGAAAPAPRVTLEVARGTALGRIPGEVVEEELEKENGRLVYSFEIRPTEAGTTLKEVHVDANDGTIVAVEDEKDEKDDEKDDKDEKDDDKD